MTADNLNENIQRVAFNEHCNLQIIADKVDLYEKEETFVQSVWAIDRNFQFTGTTAVKSHSDVSHIMRLLENKIVEHAFAIHVNNDGKSYIQLLSIGGMDSTVVDARVVLEGVNKFGSQKVYLVHNHPSGNLQPSKGDIDVTSKIFKGLNEMGIEGEHVIIDGLTGLYAVIANDLITSNQQRHTATEDVELEVQFLESHKFLKISAVIIQDFSDIVHYIQSLHYLAFPKRAMLVLDKLNRIIGNYILDEFRAKEILEKFTKAGGGTSVILYGNEEAIEKANEVRQKLINFDIALLDFIIVSHTDDITRQYKSVSERKLLREVQENYGTNMLNEPMAKVIADIADLRAQGVSDEDIRDFYMDLGDNTEAEIDSVLNPESIEEVNAKKQIVEPTNKRGAASTKKILISLIIIILILAFLNPTRQDFAEYKGYRKDHKFDNISRKANFIIFSIYTEKGKTYFAILKNFFD